MNPKRKPARKTKPTRRAGVRPRSSRPRGEGKLTAAQLYALLEKLDVGVSLITKTGRVAYVNAYGRGLFDMPDRDPVGLPTTAYEAYTIWPDGRPCRADEYPPTRCLRHGELWATATLGLKLPGGGVRWVTVTAAPLLDPRTGKPQCAVVTIAPSHEPGHVEQALRESEDRYRRLVELAPDAIIVHRGGPIAYINDAGVRLYGGQSREDFLGRDVLELVPPASRDKVRRRIEDAIRGQATPLDVQRHVRLDGSHVWVEVTGTRCMYRGEECVQVISRDVTRRRQAERALRRAKVELERRVIQRTEELSRKNAELEREQRLMQRTLALQERDRKLIAYDIHDAILQDVIGAVMFLDAVYEQHHDERLKAPLDQARKLLRNSISEARRMISGLRPLIIDEQGIVGGIEYLVNEHRARGQDIRFSHAVEPGRLGPELETAVFRIVQEALSNVERHSRSRKGGEVSLSQSDGRLRIVVRDRGVGFDPQAVAEGHYGLEGIRERARLAGGSATIKSAPRKGTEVTVVLPLVEAQDR